MVSIERSARCERSEGSRAWWNERVTRAAPEHTHPDDVPVQTALAALANHSITLVRSWPSSAEWARSCGSFDVPVGKAALSHHFAVLRGAGLVEQRDEGPKRVDPPATRGVRGPLPGLLDLVLREDPTH